jgi:hypothetical protein
MRRVMPRNRRCKVCRRASIPAGFDRVVESAVRAWCAVLACGVIAVPQPVLAQSAERLSLDTVIGVDAFAGERVSRRPQVIVDVAAGVRLGDNTQAYVRPWFRLPRPNTPGSPPPEWSKELYAAGIRYERPAERDRPALRVDVGYNVSPIGLGVIDARPSLNPTISPHISYLSPMPAFDANVPRVSAISATYPLGAQLTMSSTGWDARGAVLNAAPTRIYAVGRPTKPRQSVTFIAGAGVTPTAGLRVGISVALGHYATAAEVTGPFPAARSVTLVAAEAEYAVAYTKLSGEVVRSRFERSVGSADAYEWFVQGLQTLTPRWFAAGRHESTLAPALITPTFTGQSTRMSMVEATAGFRVTPEVTLRASYYTRKSYGASTWDNQVGVSAVWARKWW